MRFIFGDAVAVVCTAEYPLVPQQPNGVDCGFYMLEMLRRLVQEPALLQKLAHEGLPKWFTVCALILFSLGDLAHSFLA